jgi:hypothetical protein
MEELIKRLERVIQTGAPDKDGQHPISAEVVLEVIKELSELSTNLASLGTDCISRQAAIKAIDECYCGGEDSCGEPWVYIENAVEAIQMIEPIPPVEPKKGKWIKTARWGRVYYCDQCRNYLDFDGVNAGRGSTNFCPNCGCRMDGGE